MLRLNTTGPALALGSRVATPPAGRARPSPPAPEFRELWLRADPRELRRARWLVDTVANDHGLDEDERFRLTFAVNEAVANAIEHGSTSPDGYILLRTCSEGDVLSFEVHDWGRFVAKVGQPEALPERGRGLALMASMVDEVDVCPGGDATVVRLAMRVAA
jgi:anti-sigma regulatory factor (Ser/Thr protein kinase)